MSYGIKFVSQFVMDKVAATLAEIENFNRGFKPQLNKRQPLETPSQGVCTGESEPSLTTEYVVCWSQERVFTYHEIGWPGTRLPMDSWSLMHQDSLPTLTIKLPQQFYSSPDFKKFDV